LVMVARRAPGALPFPLTAIITSDKKKLSPHVHIFDGKNKFVGRWDIENQRPMDEFELTKQLRKALHELGYLRGEP